MGLFFSLTTPAGIAIGTGISSVYNENSPTALIVQGLLDSVAAGILIYMALVDLLAADFMHPRVQSKPKLQCARSGNRDSPRNRSEVAHLSETEHVALLVEEVDVLAVGRRRQTRYETDLAERTDVGRRSRGSSLRITCMPAAGRNSAPPTTRWPRAGAATCCTGGLPQRASWAAHLPPEFLLSCSNRES
ncbi:hypothetical protein GW17_00061005 [Ensete ventricosum]|nr:hypothetical protein GW17_00061005 [Ensete ventricosum]